MAKNVKSGSGGTNVPDGEKVLSFVERIENLQGDLGKEKSAFMTAAKLIHNDIKEVYKEAKAEAGLNKKGLKKLLEKRALEGKLEDLRTDEDAEAVDAFDAYCAALEKIAA